ncbi:MAG: sodium-dependent transporter [Natronospirillum sp.]|uniref:sodium-dependent transporter n=1 Tax=Natronospirillum sp. TaxID=2812955 RepID=UPI0025D280E9|nr:sodium-dependent transporter [Natronospirillum sp.]MCH8551828.1 sodium-dependent transporter [Natronospirillum sp.]
MATLVQHNFWRHRWLFALALSGAVISLSNVFSFPMAISSGGGAFLVAYLIAHVALAVPVIMTELLIGRRGRHSAPHSLAHIAAEAFVSQRWRYLGVVVVITGMIVAAYYLAFSSWALDYAWRSASGTLPDTEIGLRFAMTELLADNRRMILLHSLVCLLILVGLALPSHWGVQLPVAIMGAVLLFAVAALALWVMGQGLWSSGVNRLFDGEASLADPDIWVRAATLSFYSLGLGLGISLVLGAHMDERFSLGGTALWVVLVDLLWGMMFAAVVLGVVGSIESSDALAFVFVNVPLAMMQTVSQASTGWLTLLYLVVLLSGVSTGMFLVKHAVMWLHERYQISRYRAAVIAVAVVWGLGVAVLLSFNVWREIRFYGATILDWFANIPANLMLPAVCLLTVIYAGWVMPAHQLVEEVRPVAERRFTWWHFHLRFGTTLALLAVLVIQVQFAWAIPAATQLLLLALVVTLGWAGYRYRHWDWESS